MASSEMVHVLEHCRITPPPGSVDGSHFVSPSLTCHALISIISSGNHKRNEIDFHPLAVQMSSTTFGPLIVPLLAIQVTLFRNSAICIGFTFHHIAGDAIGMGSYLKPKSGLKQIWALNQPARSTPDMKLLIDLSNKWLLQPAF
ncbi:hypothetical protein CK203_059407 [Vitis vinifera]|uniref:Uncharacterized protein n=1 Tax=Vitis vinifera TaxID=29760 RepID=A0A438GF74_VITVI|nr:hypothetical protein CK203_059407 [Vitis vinifera]